MTIELDDESGEKFKLFCLMTEKIGKDWKITKVQSYPNGNVVLYIKSTPQLTIIVESV